MANIPARGTLAMLALGDSVGTVTPSRPSGAECDACSSHGVGAGHFIPLSINDADDKLGSTSNLCPRAIGAPKAPQPTRAGIEALQA